MTSPDSVTNPEDISPRNDQERRAWIELAVNLLAETRAFVRNPTQTEFDGAYRVNTLRTLMHDGGFTPESIGTTEKELEEMSRVKISDNFEN